MSIAKILSMQAGSAKDQQTNLSIVTQTFLWFLEVPDEDHFGCGRIPKQQAEGEEAGYVDAMPLLAR